MMFKTYKIYIRVKRDQVTVIDLVSGTQVTRDAETPFSSVRNVIGKFNPANETILAALGDLGIRRSGRISAIIQQMEGTEGGLSDIEKRALRDLAEMAGATKVYLEEGERALTMDEAMARIG